jgi:hypothetical protein
MLNAPQTHQPHTVSAHEMELASATTLTPTIYLPLVAGPCTALTTPFTSTLGPTRTVNAPYFPGTVSTTIPFSQTAIFWFGHISPTANYADVRVGYNDTELYVYVAVIDRLLWYTTTPNINNLTAYDAVTLYLSKEGASGSAPNGNAYRLVAQPNWFEARTNYQAAYQGNGAGWSNLALPVTTVSGWRGSGWNNTTDDKGWAMTYHIPFSSLGLTCAPTQGTVWGIGVAVHDRDDAAGTPLADKFWPESFTSTQPATWGQLRFGLPAYAPPIATPRQVALIRQSNTVTVTDAAVGGSTDCGASTPSFWTQWGNAISSDPFSANVQNQDDISDWPCFSKYYVKFPLSAMPTGKKIISATLTLHQKGGSGPASNGQQPPPSLIQIFSIADDWSETTITWNNAPLAFENVSRAWVQPISGCGSTIAWPCVPRSWELSAAVAQAYAAGQPLRIALYSADGMYSTGKYFVTSDTGDWNYLARPTLEVLWGD